MVEDLTNQEAIWVQQHLEERTDPDQTTPDEPWNFEWKVIPNEGLWIYAEDYGCPEHVAQFLEQFLQKFRPKAAIGFEWAALCSKPRVGEFGGGACVVTAEKTRWMATGRWLARTLERLAKTA